LGPVAKVPQEATAPLLVQRASTQLSESDSTASWLQAEDWGLMLGETVDQLVALVEKERQQLKLVKSPHSMALPMPPNPLETLAHKVLSTQIVQVITMITGLEEEVEAPVPKACGHQTTTFL
jgi:hypothetical protein